MWTEVEVAYFPTCSCGRWQLESYPEAKEKLQELSQAEM